LAVEVAARETVGAVPGALELKAAGSQAKAAVVSILGWVQAAVVVGKEAVGRGAKELSVGRAA